MTRFCLLLMLPLLVGVAVFAQSAQPAFIEAEDAAVVSASVNRVADESASRGAYLTSNKIWQTLVVADVPSADPQEKFSIWIRLRGLPIALKAAGGVRSHELRWIHHAPDNWEWRKLGTFTREQLSERVSFMRGRGEESEGGLDAIFIGPPNSSPLGGTTHQDGIEQDALHDDITPPPAYSAEAQDKAVSARIAIDWSTPEHETSRRNFSLNSTAGARPQISGHPNYAKNMAYMNAGVLRYHKGVVPGSLFKPSARGGDGWIDVENRQWNREVIREAFDTFRPEPGTDIVVSIAYWPPWMDQDKRLNPDDYEAFAAFCAELVRIINIEQQRGVRYFEILNERDFVYWRAQLKADEPPLTAELAKIFLLSAEAMKRVDPTIKTGGPAAASGETNVFPMHREFIELTKPQLDFFSFHGYATGTAGQTDAFIYDKANWLGTLIRRHRNLLEEISPDRHIELHFNEYNIAWTWRINEPRMRNHKGAVFDSLLMVAAVKAGADVTNAWNDQESTYGKLDAKNDFALRIGAHVFHYFNLWLIGQSVSTTTDHPRAVVPFAVDSGDRRSFVLINRSSVENTVDLVFTGGSPPDGPVSMARISGSGLEEADGLPSSTLRERLTLPPDSVSFYSFETP